MHSFRWGGGLLMTGLALLLLAQGAARTQEKDAVDLKVVKYDGLADAILKNRGQVIVVDFWADY